MSDVSAREPIFNVPGAVLAVLTLMIAIHGGLTLLDPEFGEWLIISLAFIPARYAVMGTELPGGLAAAIASPVTHMLVHGSWAHLMFNGASLLAFGGGLARRTSGARFLLLSLVAGLAGAFLFWLLNQGLLRPMVGASGAIAGMMGATMRYFFSALDSGGFRQLREAPEAAAMMSLPVAMRDRRVQLATGVFLFLNMLAFFDLGAPEDAGGIAWEAHIGGYLAGFLCYGFFDRGGDRVSQLHNNGMGH